MTISNLNELIEFIESNDLTIEQINQLTIATINTMFVATKTKAQAIEILKEYQQKPRPGIFIDIDVLK